MATLYIDEYKDIPTLTSWGAMPQAPQAPPLAVQHLTISGSSTPSATFNVNTNFVLIHTDAICSIAFSNTSTPPTAVGTAQRMNANETRFYGVRGGGTMAVISNT